MVRASRRHAAVMKKIFALSDQDIDALLPRDIFRMLAKVAMKVNDERMLMQIARDWAPYEHARKNETVTFTPEEIRRLADAARTEASRRGMVIDIAERRPERALSA
jgi:hypothetical protein